MYSLGYSTKRLESRNYSASLLSNLLRPLPGGGGGGSTGAIIDQRRKHCDAHPRHLQAACENSAMNFQKIIVPVLGVVGVVLAYRFYGWAGVAAAATGLVMWVLLHFTRMMTILKRAASRPIGYVDSAVMLNAKLKPGMTLLHVVAMTRALGALQSAKDAQPEIFRWTDGGESQVTATFVSGKLVQHELFRPTETAPEPADDSVNDPAS